VLVQIILLLTGGLTVLNSFLAPLNALLHGADPTLKSFFSAALSGVILLIIFIKHEIIWAFYYVVIFTLLIATGWKVLTEELAIGLGIWKVLLPFVLLLLPVVRKYYKVRVKTWLLSSAVAIVLTIALIFFQG